MPQSDTEHDDDLDLELDDLDPADDTPLVRKLRAQLKKAGKQNRDLTSKVQSYERTDAIREAGLNLTARQLKVLAREHEGDITPEALKATAEELGWTVPDPEAEETDAELDAIEQTTQAASGAKPKAAGSTISVEEAASWPVDKQQRFMKQHPDAWEALKRGEEVRGIVF